MNALVYRSLLYPAWHWLKRDQINHARNELNRSQWWTKEEIDESQNRKLNDLLTFAGRYVPYYRKLFREVGLSFESETPAELLSQIPPLTKQRIRDAGGDMLSENLEGNKLLPNSTSGSTGEALRFFSDWRSFPYRQASEIRSDSFTGWNLGEKVVRLWGSPIDRNRAKALRGRVHGWFSQDRFLSSFELSTVALERHTSVMKSFKPRLLVGYPGPLEQFALHCIERRIRVPSLKGVVSSAEVLWPQQRSTVEDAFGVPVFDRYGCREVGQVAAECLKHTGLHVSADRLLVEVVKQDMNLCEPGEEGRILVTDLHNFGMPFIRYDIGDFGVWSSLRSCACGRGLPLLASVGGRSLDVVRTADGQQVGGTFWTLLLRSRPGIRQFQVLQESFNGVTVYFVRDEGLEPTTLLYFGAKIKERLGNKFLVNFVEKECISNTESGKQRIVMSRIREEGV